MTYLQCLNQLEEQGLKDKFCSLFEPVFEETFFKRLNETDKLHSLPSLIRTSLTYLEIFSEDWEYWAEILRWYMTPVFARKPINEFLETL